MSLSETLDASGVHCDPQHNGCLHTGWWGLSRHFHYVPEITAAFLWTVPGGFTHLLPYFYVVFLTLLLTVRSSSQGFCGACVPEEQAVSCSCWPGCDQSAAVTEAASCLKLQHFEQPLCACLLHCREQRPSVPFWNFMQG